MEEGREEERQGGWGDAGKAKPAGYSTPSK